jgi:Protein of unknown function (DUF3892)
MIITTCSMQATCTTKTSYQSPDARISHIGGYGWLFTQEQAVRAISNGQYALCMYAEGRIANIIIASYEGNLYLKAVTDSEHPEKLLSLPDFDEKGVLLTLSQNKIFMESLAEEELRILAS